MNGTKTLHCVIADVLELYELKIIRYQGIHLVLWHQKGSQIGQNANYGVKHISFFIANFFNVSVIRVCNIYR